MKISLWKKISVCALAGFLMLFAVHTDLNHRLPVWLPEIVVTLFAFTLLIISLLYIFMWQFFEYKNKFDSQRILAFWQGIIIYCEALIFLRFGFLKIFALHMNSTLIAEDFPAGTMSDYHLMDYFFSRAPEFKILIGFLQIVGASTLLFRQTRLLGIFILMPVIVNIVCMDLFYNIGTGITITAIVLLVGLIYLLFQEREKLFFVFFTAKSTMPVFVFGTTFKKNIIRFSTLALTLVILIPSIQPRKNASILGKYSVKELNLNGKQVMLNCNNDSQLADIYFDENETCLLRYNNYRNIKIGKAIYDEPTGKLTVMWRFPKKEMQDTSYWNLSESIMDKKFILSGKTGKESLKATMIKTSLATVLFN